MDAWMDAQKVQHRMVVLNVYHQPYCGLARCRFFFVVHLNSARIPAVVVGSVTFMMRIQIRRTEIPSTIQDTQRVKSFHASDRFYIHLLSWEYIHTRELHELFSRVNFIFNCINFLTFVLEDGPLIYGLRASVLIHILINELSKIQTSVLRVGT